MRFGRVEGYVTRDDDDPAWLRLIVTLESGRNIDTIRDERVRALRSTNDEADLLWQADQYTQETIGVQLCEDGWEVFGASDPPTSSSDGLYPSARYAVRNLG